jgi:hypothetical protein
MAAKECPKISLILGLLILGTGGSILTPAHRSMISNVIKEAGSRESGPVREPGVIGARLPIAFEANLGQTAAAVGFIGRANGYRLFIKSDESVIALNGVRSPRRQGHSASQPTILEAPRAIRIELLDANPGQKIDARDPLPGRINYLVGQDPAGWRTDIPTYRTVTQHEVWPGIDLVYYGDSERRIESDFTVAPGADPRMIRLAFKGNDRVSIDRGGNLQIAAGRRIVTMLKPRIYQRFGGRTLIVGGRYVIDQCHPPSRDGQRVRFEVASYDRSQTLVIDPKLSLVYSTYLGGSAFDEAFAVDVDSERHAYVTGLASSPDFPVTQGRLRDSEDAFVAKFSADGSSLIYSTFIGGTGGSGVTEAYAIALDSPGHAYITGVADTKNFPTTERVFQSDAPNGGHPFVSELSLNGHSLVFSTYVASADFRKCDASDPGVDWGNGIAVDPAGDVYITGSTCSQRFPLNVPFQFGSDVDLPSAFVTELDPKGRQLFFSTYLGGAGLTQGNAIAIDPNLVAPGIYVTGITTARNFPTKNPFQAHRHAFSDAFVTKFEKTNCSCVRNRKLVYSTYLGGDNGDEGRGIKVDRHAHAYVIGNYASFDFPIRRNLTPHDEPIPGIFITKFSQDGESLLYSDSLGGFFGDNSGNSIALFGEEAYVTGYTDARQFPVVNAFQDEPQGGRDAFVSKISRDGKSLVYSTYLGGTANDEGNGIAVGPGGAAFVTGRTDSVNFPTQQPFQPQMNGKANAFVAKLEM